MSHPVIIGLDLGTSGCRAVAVDQSGRTVASSSAPILTQRPQPGWAEQNASDWVDAAVSTLRAVSAACDNDPIALALSAAAHIGVLLDGDFQPLLPAITWQDQRTVHEVAEIGEAAGDIVLAQTYQAVSPGWTLPHLAWIRRHHATIWERVRHIELSKDYLYRFLTGVAATDPGTALSSQLYDARRHEWSRELCDLAGVAREKLPPVYANTDTPGHITAAVAQATGLPPGIPVVVGGLDSACELIAAGVVHPGEMALRLASAGGAQIVFDRPEANRRLITYPHAVGGGWYRQASTSACASSVAWARDLLSPGASFEQWDAEAATSPPGAAGLLFEPHLAGERAPYWNPALRGRLSGLTISHSRADIARAVYEGTAYSIRDAMRAFGDTNGNALPVPVVGGGARSGIWLRILASVLARPLRAMPDASSALGAALLGWQALSGGLRGASEESDASIVLPDQNWTAAYEAGFAAYLAAHQAG